MKPTASDPLHEQALCRITRAPRNADEVRQYHLHRAFKPHPRHFAHTTDNRLAWELRRCDHRRAQLASEITRTRRSRFAFAEFDFSADLRTPLWLALYTLAWAAIIILSVYASAKNS